MALHFEDRGSGAALLLLHAFPLSSEMWASNAGALRAEGFRTILPDFPGFGRSGGLMGDISESAELVVEVLDKLDLREIFICGLSMGGYVAFEVIRLIADRISGALFCDTNPDKDSLEKREERIATVKHIELNGSSDKMEELARTLISPTTFADHPQTTIQITSQFKAAGESAVCAALVSMANRSDSNDLLSQIDFPVKLIFGADDVMLPAAFKMKSAMGTATLETIPEAGHFPNLETPAQFNRAVIKFLKETNS